MPEPKSDHNQEKAIKHTAGAVQVFAGPGSGKTYVTVQRIRYLITQQGIDPSHILVITFTKAAALEMQERFFRLMEPERPPVRFGTFHAVFYHILRQSAQYRGYSIITESEKRKLLKKIIHMHQRFDVLQEEDFEELVSAVGTYRASSPVRPMSVKTISEEDIEFLFQEYESYLQEFRQMDFDGITHNCRLLLKNEPTLLAQWQAQFRFIMIDEFQDISSDQYEIIKLLAAPENNIFIVGDDDQSIYGFRGASPNSMQDFMHDFQSANRIFLDVNYRCDGRIVDAACKVIEENRNRVYKKIKAAHTNGKGFHLHIFDCESHEEEYLIRELHSKKEQGELEECAMICRTNYECTIWANNLHKGKIPFYMKETPRNPFDHFVIRDIMAYLALAYGKCDRKYFLRIMNRPVRYIKRDSVCEEYISESGVAAFYRDTPVIQQEVLKLFRNLESMNTKKLHLQIHYIRKVIGYDKYLQDKYDAEKAKELIQKAVDFQKLAEQYADYQDLDNYISKYAEIIQSINNTESSKGKDKNGLPNQKEGISLMTMHASKGLEFRTVYLPNCQEGKIPSNRSKTPEEIEEERRMFYVAMTRAKHELYITAYKGKSGKDVPSRFLQCLCQSSSSTISSNSEESRYSSKASTTASYSSSSSMYASTGSSFGSSGFSL